jgi:hypothetical protein
MCRVCASDVMALYSLLYRNQISLLLNTRGIPTRSISNAHYMSEMHIDRDTYESLCKLEGDCQLSLDVRCMACVDGVSKQQNLATKTCGHSCATQARHSISERVWPL